MSALGVATGLFLCNQMPSAIWGHFITRPPEWTKVSCTLCKATISRGGDVKLHQQCICDCLPLVIKLSLV